MQVLRGMSQELWAMYWLLVAGRYLQARFGLTCGAQSCKSGHAFPDAGSRGLVTPGIRVTPACEGGLSLLCIQSAQATPSRHQLGVQLQGSAESILFHCSVGSAAAKSLPQAGVGRFHADATCRQHNQEGGISELQLNL